jgi:hypothetical protein
MMEWAPSPVQRHLPAVSWTFVSLFVGIALLPLEPNLLEEGMLVHVAQRLVAGEVLYRDVVYFSGPLPFELLAFLFRVFGESTEVTRYAIVAMHGLTTFCFADLGRRSGAGAHAVGAALALAPILLFPLLSIYFYTTLAFYLSLLAAAAASRGLVSDRWSLAAGTLVAAVALCKQNLGVALAFTLAGAMLLLGPRERRFRPVLAFVAGGAGVTLATVAVYGASGQLGDLAHSLVTLPLSLGGSFSVPWPPLWPPGEVSPEWERNAVLFFPSLVFLIEGQFKGAGSGLVLLTQLLYLVPPLALVQVALRFLRGPRPAELGMVAALMLAWLANLHPRPDWGHLTYLLPIALVALLISMGGMPSQGDRWSFLRTSLTVIAMVGLSAGGSWALWALHASAGPRTFGPRIRQHPVSWVYKSAAVPRVIRYLRKNTQPGDPVFIARQEPLIYFATDTRNPTPYEGILPGLENQESTILEALTFTRFVVMSDIAVPGYGGSYAQELPRVQAELERQYRIPGDFPVDQHSWIVVAERGEDRGRAAIDLIAIQQEARRWTRDGAGRERTTSAPVPHGEVRQMRRPLLVALGQGGGGIDFVFELPLDAHFEADLGSRTILTEDGPLFQAAPIEMRVSIREATRDGEFQVIDVAPLRGGRRSGWRWEPRRVDLRPWGGHRVNLRLEAVPMGSAVGDQWTWWGSPRVVTAASHPLREEPQE